MPIFNSSNRSRSPGALNSSENKLRTSSTIRQYYGLKNDARNSSGFKQRSKKGSRIGKLKLQDYSSSQEMFFKLKVPFAYKSTSSKRILSRIQPDFQNFKKRRSRRRNPTNYQTCSDRHFIPQQQSYQEEHLFSQGQQQQQFSKHKNGKFLKNQTFQDQLFKPKKGKEVSFDKLKSKIRSHFLKS